MLPALFNKRIFLLTVIFVLAFSLRFMFISKGAFHIDTLDLAITAQKTLDHHTLYYEHGTGYPLAVICGAFFIFFFKLFGIADPVFCVNFMSVLTGAFSILLLFFLVEKLFDFDRAVFSAILLSFFMPHMAISTFGKSLTLSICMSLASAYYMVVYTRTYIHRYLIYSAVFLGFCAAARLSDIFVFMPVIFLYFSSGKIDYAKVKGFIVFMMISSTAALLYYLPMLLDQGLSQFIDVWHSKGGAQFVGIFSLVFKHNLQLFWHIFSMNGVLIFMAGFIYMALKKQYRQLLFLLFWFLPLFIFYAGVSSSGPRYLVIAWIPLLAAQGYFLGSFKKNGRILARTVLFSIIFVNFFLCAPTLAFRHKYALQEEFALWVSSKTPPDAWIIAIDEGMFLKYYGKRRYFGRPIFGKASQVDAFLKELDSFLLNGEKVYIITSGLGSYDGTGLFKKKLFQDYHLSFIGKKQNEDWHHALLNLDLFQEGLYKIEKKNE